MCTIRLRYIIEPTQQQETDYCFLLEVQAAILKNMTAGKQAGELYDAPSPDLSLPLLLLPPFPPSPGGNDRNVPYPTL